MVAGRVNARHRLRRRAGHPGPGAAMGEPLHTRRFAGPAADNDERLRRLLELMCPYRGEDRRASWVEALTIAHSGRVLVSWELHGGVGYLDEQPPVGPLPEFWVFSVWRFPQFCATYSQLNAEQRESIDDHWSPTAPPRPPLPDFHLRSAPWRIDQGNRVFKDAT